MKYGNIREEELKNKVALDFFKGFDCTEIKGCIDFAVAPLNPPTGGKRSSPCGGCWEGAYNVNASLYDIKEFFKGRDEKGKMNNRSQDEEFNRLEQILSEKLKILAAKIEPKVYEYEFLMD